SAQVANEEEKDTAGTWKISKSYAYGANGENLSLTDTPVNTTTTKKSYYGLNPHGDTETLTDAITGQTTSTYRYTAYGQPDKIGTTGDDAITGDPAQDADTVNPYRFNAARYNGATNTYDMGFREYNPGLNRFLTRDAYAGALSDVSLGTDPWNTNRYAFGGGNPISRVELNGHLNAPGSEGGGGLVNARLEICGSDCYLDFTSGSLAPIDPSPDDGDIVKIAKPLLHTTLDGLGMAPVVGEAADGANCAWYTHDGEKFNAATSCGAMIPFLGWGSTAAKWFGKGTKLSDEALQAAADLCRGNSFTADTRVLMADGTTKPIKDLKLGDHVMASTPAGRVESQEVTDLIRHSGPHIMVAIRLPAGTINATDHHPFWTVDSARWTDAIGLKRGDTLRTSSGHTTPVISTAVNAADLTAYNFTVKNLHTYYVMAGDVPVLVHNCGDLLADDARFPGAHVLDEHVNVTDQQLVQMAQSSGVKSRFVDLQTAQQVVDYGIASSAKRITAWLRTGGIGPLEIKGNFGAKNPIGVRADAGGSIVPTGNSYTIVLQRAAGHSGGYYVSTAYPR
ncbi:RNase A-like domain-containing protein, partial [Kribbella sp. NPDC020789]